MAVRTFNFVFEVLAPATSAAAASPCGVAALEHEISNVAVEDDIVIISSFG